MGDSESLRTTYTCSPCGQTSDVTVSDLWGGPPDATPDAKAGILQLRAERELKFATCPRCNSRNPVGVAEQTKANKQWRWGFIAFFAVLGAGIWFVPVLAWVLVAIDAIIAAVVVYLVKRMGGDGRAKKSAAITVLTFVVIVATAIFYPRWVAVFALIVLVQSVRKKQSVDEVFENAKAKLVFVQPYR